jgi:glycerol uptake facilitator-like aquaporin
MNKRRISIQFLLYFLMMIFLMITVSCSSSSSSPATTTTTYTVKFDSQGATVAAKPASKTVVSPATTVGTRTVSTYTGYTFASWWTGIGGSGTEFTASDGQSFVSGSFTYQP